MRINNTVYQDFANKKNQTVLFSDSCDSFNMSPNSPLTRDKHMKLKIKLDGGFCVCAEIQYILSYMYECIYYILSNMSVGYKVDNGRETL